MKKRNKSDIPDNIKCSFTELVDLNELIPNPRNPNTHPVRQIELLAKIIKYQGWRRPITVSRRSGFIIKGHGAREAGLMIGETLAPIDYQDYENEADEWADMVADNEIAKMAENDPGMLQALMDDLEKIDFDLEMTGIDQSLWDQLEVGDKLDKDDEKDVNEFQLDHKCPKCGFEFDEEKK